MTLCCCSSFFGCGRMKQTHGGLSVLITSGCNESRGIVRFWDRPMTTLRPDRRRLSALFGCCCQVDDESDRIRPTFNVRMRRMRLKKSNGSDWFLHRQDNEMSESKTRRQQICGSHLANGAGSGGIFVKSGRWVSALGAE